MKGLVNNPRQLIIFTTAIGQSLWKFPRSEQKYFLTIGLNFRNWNAAKQSFLRYDSRLYFQKVEGDERDEWDEGKDVRQRYIVFCDDAKQHRR